MPRSDHSARSAHSAPSGRPAHSGGKWRLLLCCAAAMIILPLALVLAYHVVPGAAGARSLLHSKLFGGAEPEGFVRVYSGQDKNQNGADDIEDIITGAREETFRRPVYRSAYYKGGYPPGHEGVCTDVIWRAMKHAGYDLKALVDADIRRNPGAYPRAAKPDPNIDFRRVPNLRVFFSRHWQTLPAVTLLDKTANLNLWQPGDIVTFGPPDHVAILSDRRNSAGFPLLLHNDAPWASEEDSFAAWAAKGLTGHYRLPARR